MREVLEAVEGWRREGKGVALATVVSVWGSAPRRPGAKMAISSAGEVAGSVSGGCVEGAVVEAAGEALAAGEPRLLSFGVSDETAWSVGLSCGGEIVVYVEPVARDGEWEEVHRALAAALREERLAAVATVIAGPGAGRRSLLAPGGERRGSLGSAERDRAAEAHLGEALRTFAPVRFAVEDGAAEDVSADVFLEPHPPRPRLVLVGAVHTAIPLLAIARELGFWTCVIDPRSAFATPERFAGADQLLREWPQDALPRLGLNEATYLATLSHDPKIDLPALEVALASPCRYIGALGSKRTHAKRVAALGERGFTAEAITRIHAPIGLDVGAQSPAEVAVAIAGQIVAVAHGRS
jgi:xanthine dehydrogenase accessory factor